MVSAFRYSLINSFVNAAQEESKADAAAAANTAAIPHAPSQ